MDHPIREYSIRLANVCICGWDILFANGLLANGIYSWAVWNRYEKPSKGKSRQNLVLFANEHAGDNAWFSTLEVSLNSPHNKRNACHGTTNERARSGNKV